jgi:vacuolar-type H+-ATPase subunit B/Vma2
LFSALPEEDLKLIKEDFVKKYLPKYRVAEADKK